MKAASRVIELEAKYNLDISQAKADLRDLQAQMARIRELEEITSNRAGWFKPGGGKWSKQEITAAKAELERLVGTLGSADRKIEELGRSWKDLLAVIQSMSRKIRLEDKATADQQKTSTTARQAQIREIIRTEEVAHRAKMNQLREEARARRAIADADAAQARAEAARVRLMQAQARAAGAGGGGGGGGGRLTAWQRGPNRFGGVAGFAQLPGGGLTTGVIGMLGTNLYGAGVLGLAGAGARSAMDAYAESYNLKVMLAGVIQTFGEFRDKTGNIVEGMEKYEKSRAFSEELFTRLRRKAADSPVTFQDLSQGYLVAAPYLAKSGLSFDQSLDVTNLLVTLGKMQNLPLKSIVDDIRALSTGRLTNAQTLQSMGFTKEDMGQLRQLQGDDLYNFLMEKGKGFREAMKEFEGSFTVAWDRMLDAFYTMRIKFGEKLAVPLSQFAKDITNTLNQWELDGTLDKFINTSVRLMEWGGKIAKFLVENLESVLNIINVYLAGKIATGLYNAIVGMIASAQAGMAAGAGGGLVGRGLLGGVAALATANPVGAAIVGLGLAAGGAMWAETRIIENEANTAAIKATARQYIYSPGEGENTAVAEHIRNYLKTGKLPSVPTEQELESIGTKDQFGAFAQKYSIGAGKARSTIENALGKRGSRAFVNILPDYEDRSELRKYVQQYAGNLPLTGALAQQFASKGYLGSVTYNQLRPGDQASVIDYLERTKNIQGGFTGFTIPQERGQVRVGNDPLARRFLEEKLKELDPTPNVVTTPPGLTPPKTPGVSSVTMEPDITAETRQIGELELANDALGFRLGQTGARDFYIRAELVRQRNANQRKIAELKEAIAQSRASKEVRTTGEGGLSGEITRNGVTGVLHGKKGEAPLNIFGGDIQTTREALKAQNKGTRDANLQAEASIELQATLQQLGFELTEQIQKYWEEYTTYLESVRQGRLDMRESVLRLVRAKDFASNDPNRSYSANLALLQIEAERIYGKVQGAGVAGAVGRMLSLATPAGLNLFGKLGALQTARDEALTEQRRKDWKDMSDRQMSASTRAFRTRAGEIGLSGFDLTQYRLNNKISRWEEALQDPVTHGLAKAILPGLYELRAAIEKNTEVQNKQLSLRLSQATDAIFSSGERLSPTAQYRQRFDDAMAGVDNMTDDQVRGAFASIPFLGRNLANQPVSVLRNMLKVNQLSGFSNAGFKGAMFQERGMGMVSAVIGAMSSGQDPLQALLGVKGKGPGDDAMQRLVESMFNGNVYRTVKGPGGKMMIDRGAFSRDLISGGGSFLANYAVQQGLFGKNNYASELSQVGGMMASMGAFAGLGAFAGPVGILGGALIGSLFGKRRQEDPAIAQHRKNLEDLLKTIGNRLKPQEDFYRTIRGDAIWGSASRMYAGRSSSLGARVSLGVL